MICSVVLSDFQVRFSSLNDRLPSLAKFRRLYLCRLVRRVVRRLGYSGRHVLHLVVDLVQFHGSLPAQLSLLQQIVDDLHGRFRVVVYKHVYLIVRDVAESASEELEEELLVAVVLADHVLR